MSQGGESPKKSVVQVPDSSPLRSENKFSPQLLFAKRTNTSAGGDGGGGGTLKEKFGFNGTNLLSSSSMTTTAASLANRDLQILQSMFKEISYNMIRGVYVTKANKDIKMAKHILTKLVEKRRSEGRLSTQTPGATPATSNGVSAVSAMSPSKDAPIVITSSPTTSPVKSSKVTLDKSKSIQQKYSNALRKSVVVVEDDSAPVLVQDEPVLKKRKLVRGSRLTPPEAQHQDNGVIEATVVLDDDSNDEMILKDEFTDDEDVDDHAMVDHSDEDFQFQQKVLQFFNEEGEFDIMDIAQCSAETANAIIAKRPFKTITQFESLNFDVVQQSKRRKPQGELFSNRANVALRGYSAVDNLVAKCDTYSEQIAQEISKWGVEVHGINDELEIVEVDIDDDEGDEIGSTGRKQKSKYFKDKPSLLAPGIELKSYQQVGINWLYLLYSNNLSCILADEMGLGKTCQVIAFLSYLKQLDINKGPHLVVVPSSTLENWMREFNKFAPSLVVEPYYGSQREREDIRELLLSKWEDIDVIVTTYNLATGSKDDFSFLKHGGFNVVVYDEGHMLKNSTSDRFIKLMKLKANFRLLLTGTPLQNNLKELMSLLEFILPSIFVSEKEGLKYVFNQKASTKDSSKDYNPLLSQRAINKAKKMMAPFILRRRKDQVLKHLPPKIQDLQYCDMTPEQALIYDREIERGVSLKRQNNGKTANILMALRKAAIHPLLFRSIYDDDKLKIMAKDIMKEPQYATANETYIFEDMQVMTDFELNNLCVQFPSIDEFKLDEAAFLNSGKVAKLGHLLPEIIEQDGKVLIFSLFTQVLDILEPVLSMWDIKFLRLDGQTPVDMRQDLIDKFSEEESIPVFLLSTKAGGFGINLVCANHVILFDQSFNPHDDKQAEDRAHRVGQERDVTVTRLITRNSIEESMYQLAQNKLELDQTMSGDQIESKAISLIGDMVFTKKGESEPSTNEEITID